ncbi:MAG: crossover junction endodeoxyribonuclease RuvC [Patescibacteria group bacterium]
MMRIIMGIDPGLGRTGYGVIQEDGGVLTAIDFGCVLTQVRGPIGARLVELYNDLVELMENYQPDLIVIEDLYFNKNVTTGIQVGEARGVILLASEQLQIPVISFTATQMKNAVTGSGKATKSQVGQMVKRLLKFTVKRAMKDDTTDALALAICGSTIRTK